MWNSIVSVSDHCLFIYLDEMKSRYVSHNELKKNTGTSFYLSVQAFKVALCAAHRGLNKTV